MPKMIKGREVSALALRAASAISPLRRAMVAAAALGLLVAMSVSVAMAWTSHGSTGGTTSTGSTTTSTGSTTTSTGSNFVIPSPSSITGKEKTEDPIIVSNFGGITGGNFEVFNAPTAGGNLTPSQLVAGSHTALFGPQGIASSPLDTDTYVVASAVPAVFGFSAGDNGNDGTEFPLGCLPGLFAPPCVVGFNSPGGDAFGVTVITTATDEGIVATNLPDPPPAALIPRMWVSNNLPVINPFVGAKTPCAVGTLNAYIPDSPFGLLNSPPSPEHIFDIMDVHHTPQISTIGGCSTLLFEPEGVALDSLNRTGYSVVVSSDVVQQGLIFAVNYATGWVTIYNPQNTFGFLGGTPDGYGDAPPVGAFGVPPALASLFGFGGIQGPGTLIHPEFIAVDPFNELIYVTDMSDKSINVIAYDPITYWPFVATTFKGKIKGTNTALQSPLGIGLGAGLDDLYVANTTANKVSFFDFEAPVSGTQNISPDVVITGTKTKENQPIGISMSCFLDPAAPQCVAGCPLAPIPSIFNAITGECQCLAGFFDPYSLTCEAH
jgi:hypothetical protein